MTLDRDVAAKVMEQYQPKNDNGYDGSRVIIVVDERETCRSSRCCEEKSCLLADIKAMQQKLRTYSEQWGRQRNVRTNPLRRKHDDDYDGSRVIIVVDERETRQSIRCREEKSCLLADIKAIQQKQPTYSEQWGRQRNVRINPLRRKHDDDYDGSRVIIVVDERETRQSIRCREEKSCVLVDIKAIQQKQPTYSQQWGRQRNVRINPLRRKHDDDYDGSRVIIVVDERETRQSIRCREGKSCVLADIKAIQQKQPTYSQQWGRQRNVRINPLRRKHDDDISSVY
uniref:Uncharacterized protein n=1 Tax=Peronospora matthiolae TaxID=2874970 RepID=A0AAV1U571_9STRA